MIQQVGHLENALFTCSTCLLSISYDMKTDINFLDFRIDLQIKAEAENEFYKKEAKDMVNIVQKLILDGK